MSCRKPRCPGVLPSAALAFAAGALLGLFGGYPVLLFLLCLLLIGVVLTGACGRRSSVTR